MKFQNLIGMLGSQDQDQDQDQQQDVSKPYRYARKIAVLTVSSFIFFPFQNLIGMLGS